MTVHSFNRLDWDSEPQAPLDSDGLPVRLPIVMAGRPMFGTAASPIPSLAFRGGCCRGGM